MPLKTMFDIFLADDQPRQRALIVLADDETEARSLVKSPIADVFAYPGLVSAVGQSRVIGWTMPSPLGGNPSPSTATTGTDKSVPTK